MTWSVLLRLLRLNEGHLAQGGPGREAAYLRVYKGLKATLEQGGGHIDGDFRLVGDLTIGGVTRGMVLHVSAKGRLTDSWSAERAGFSAHGKIDRTDFGLTWNQALETGGVLVSSEGAGDPIH